MFDHFSRCAFLGLKDILFKHLISEWLAYIFFYNFPTFLYSTPFFAGCWIYLCVKDENVYPANIYNYLPINQFFCLILHFFGKSDMKNLFGEIKPSYFEYATEITVSHFFLIKWRKNMPNMQLSY